MTESLKIELDSTYTTSRALYAQLEYLSTLGCKVTSCQSWRSQEKVCQPAPAPVSQGSIPGRSPIILKV